MRRVAPATSLPPSPATAASVSASHGMWWRAAFIAAWRAHATASPAVNGVTTSANLVVVSQIRTNWQRPLF
jgi:hypothetical protein